jgi:hypothetical protein
MTPQRKNLESAIEQAWIDYNNIYAYELDSGISEEAELQNAEGFATGLNVAYSMIFGELYHVKTEICNEDNYKDWLTRV